MSVPKLRFPEFRGDEGWEAALLGANTVKIGSGITPTGGDTNYKNKGHPFIRSQNIGWGVLILDDIVFIDEQTHSTFHGTEVKQDDVFLNITGASIGRSAIASRDVVGGNVNQHVCIIRTKKSQLDPYYLNQYLLSGQGQKQIDSFQAGGNRQGLNFAQIRSFTLPLPRLPEQQKIAACISSLDDLISLEGSKFDTLKKHKQSLMQHLFPAEGQSMPRVRFQKFDTDWKQKKGGDVFNSISNKNHKSDLPVLAITQEHGAIPRELIDYNVSVTDKSIESYKVVDIGDFIISLRSFQGGIEYSMYSGICSPAYIILKPKLEIDKKFFRYYFKTKAYILRLNHKLEGLRDGKIISYKYFSEIYLPFPSLKEQKKIADCLSSLDHVITAQASYIATLKLQKKGLMQQLFPSSNEAVA